MDQSILVAGGQALVHAMDADGFGPRLAMWVHDDDDRWKLWLVPPVGATDKLDFYRRMSRIATAHRIELSGVEAGDTMMLPDDHPAAKGIGRLMKIPDLASVLFHGNLFDGFYVPEGIILRSNL